MQHTRPWATAHSLTHWTSFLLQRSICICIQDWEAYQRIKSKMYGPYNVCILNCNNNNNKNKGNDHGNSNSDNNNNDNDNNNNSDIDNNNNRQ